MGLDNYELVEELFTAAPSTFYRGRNKILGHELMVRRLSVDPARAEDVRETFFREQRLSAALSHPHIQRPIDVLEEDGYLWSVHEYHTLKPTTEMVDESGALELAEAARLGSQVADALSFMHAKGHIHGKLAPRLVVVDERGDSLLINLVKAADLAANVWPLRPAVLGLSPFTAPEEFRGEKPTKLTDVYALAATMVYWLSGKWPRGGANDEEALERARDGAPLIDLTDLHQPLPATLINALTAALEPDPTLRHGGAAAFGSILIDIFQRQAAEIPSGFSTGAQLHPTGTLDSVQILGRHGAGAFGVVLRAQDPNDSGVFAVKALKPEHRDDSDAYERFVREARALHQIQHPNVVRIHGVGEQHGTPYAVMEFISGPDLATTLLREGSLPTTRAVRLAAGIAQGLEAIHNEGIVHRDLKPHNILIAEGDRPVIADFGVARNTAATRMTMTGRIVGTPAYMAPEQFNDEPAAPSVDLFALGAILYEMLAGQTPFPAKDPLDAIRAIRESNPAPLPDDVPHSVAVIVSRLLRKDPAERYQSAALVAADLAQEVERLPV